MNRVVNAVHRRGRKAIHDSNELRIRRLAVSERDHVVRKQPSKARDSSNQNADPHRRRRGGCHGGGIADVIDLVAGHRPIRWIGVTQTARGRRYSPRIRCGDRIDRVLGDRGARRSRCVHQALDRGRSSSNRRVCACSGDVMHRIRRNRRRLGNASRA